MMAIRRRHHYRYTWRYGWKWIGGRIQQRQFISVIREFYWVMLRGYDGETCGDCARPYPWWHAPDDLWHELIDSRQAYKGGLFCIECFDKRARALDIVLQWQPVVEGRIGAQ